MNKSFLSVLVLGAAALLMIALPVAAESVEPGSVCYRIVVEFHAEEDSVISGQVGIHYYDDHREALVNVPFGTLNVEGDTHMKVAEVRVDDMQGFHVSLNTSGTIVSGSGKYKSRVLGCSVLYINDGRLNIDQLGSLAVIYKNAQTSGYDVYGVNPGTGEGTLVIRATRDAVSRALTRAAAPGGVNTLIQSSGSISLWALTSSQCQMNSFNLDGSLSEFVFDCESAAGG